MQNIHIIIKLYDNLLLVSIFKKARMSIWNCLKDVTRKRKWLMNLNLFMMMKEYINKRRTQ